MSDRTLRHPGINLGGQDSETHAQAEYGLFGFWLFLMSDAIIFALLFATYGVMLTGTAGGPAPADVFEIKSAFIETMILLTSSFTFGMASLSMKYGQRRHMLELWLVVTLLLGIAFLGFELHDFAKMFGEGATPDRSGFLSAFFALVSTHGLHVTGGCVWIAVMLVQLRTHGLDGPAKINLMRLGLFWHFLDIIWVAIFTVVYLQGLAR